MTKHDLADQSGISISFLSDLTNGKANPSLKIMEALASALDTPLPTLLEMTDLDKEALDALAGGKAPQSLPPGFVRASGVVTNYQAYMVHKWDQENRAQIAKKNLS